MLLKCITLTKQPLQKYPVEGIWSIVLHMILGAVTFEPSFIVLSDPEQGK